MSDLKRPRAPKAAAPRPATATLRVEPTGSIARSPRDYLITLELQPAQPSEGPGAFVRARALAAGSLSGVSSGTTATDGPRVWGQAPSEQATDAAPPLPTSVEAAALCADWPQGATIAAIRAELVGQGYHVTTTERRACAEPGCTADAVVAQPRRDAPPRDWYSPSICGRHNYRACGGCRSILKLRSSNVSSPAPALRCPACDTVLVEWGGSKQWDVEMVERGV